VIDFPLAVPAKDAIKEWPRLSDEANIKTFIVFLSNLYDYFNLNLFPEN